jgi:Domain of unknown function (DUF4349)
VKTPFRVALILMVLTIAACSRDITSHAAREAKDKGALKSLEYAPPATPSADAPSRSGFDAVVASAVPDATVPSVPMADETRKLIRTVQLEMIVAHVDSVSRWAQDLSTRMGGYSTDVNVWEQDGVPHAVLTLRVPATKLDESLAQLRAWSKRVEHEQQSVQDVTDQFVDVEARLKTLKMTERELLALLQESRQRGQKLDGIMAVYRELTEIRSRIEQLQGQRDALAKMTALSTIQVQLRPDEKAHPVAGTGWRPGDTVRASVRALVANLRGIADALIVVAVVAIPTVAIFAVPAWLGTRWWLRRRRTRLA